MKKYSLDKSILDRRVTELKERGLNDTLISEIVEMLNDSYNYGYVAGEEEGYCKGYDDISSDF